MLVNSDTLFTAIITIETSPNMMILLDIVWSSFHGDGSDVTVVAANRQGRLGAHFTFMVNTFEKLWRCSQWCTVVTHPTHPPRGQHVGPYIRSVV